MDAFDNRIKTLLKTKLVTLCITGILLLLSELLLADVSVALQQAPILIVTAIILTAASMGGSLVFKWVMSNGGRKAIGYYLIAKTLRIFIVIVIFLIYGIADGRNLLAFAINILALYIADVVTSIIFYVGIEKNYSKKK